MIKSDPKTGAFENIGYQTGKSLTLVRNPNWKASTSAAPAYLNNINVNIGGDATVIGQQVLKGSDSVQLDTPTQSNVKLAYRVVSVADHVHPWLGHALRDPQPRSTARS